MFGFLLKKRTDVKIFVQKYGNFVQNCKLQGQSKFFIKVIFVRSRLGRHDIMAYYEKVLLYAYPHLEDLARQIDKLVLKRALSSFSNYTSCESQCETILGMSDQKVRLLALKTRLDEILTRLTEYEMELLEYKYFKRKPRSSFSDFDSTSRQYFRRQLKLTEKISFLLNKSGMTEKWFNENYLDIDFMKLLLTRVIEYENNGNIKKNKRKKV